MRSTETWGMRSKCRRISQIPRTSKTSGRINTPQPTVCCRMFSTVPVIALRLAEIRLSRLSRPATARASPRMSSFLSSERPVARPVVLAWRVFCLARELREVLFCLAVDFLRAGVLLLRRAGLRPAI